MTKITKKVNVICDLQYGSTGKGAVADYTAMRDQPDLIVIAFTPSAGHTSVHPDGRTIVTTMTPNGIVSPKLRRILLAAGSVINMASLEKEIAETADILNERNVEYLVHCNATILSQRHVDAESDTMTSIGSTKKGGGAAIVEKIRRDPTGVAEGRRLVASEFQLEFADIVSRTGVMIRVIDNSEWQYHITNAERIQVEGTQGYSLSLNSGFWPYCTSRECTPAQLLSDCMIPVQMLDKVIGVMRTFPIRVSNRYNEAGEMIGWSGPCYPDQEELTFEQIGQIQEFTTVTKLPRRIFSLSAMQTREALAQCLPDELVLTFANYMKDDDLADAVAMINKQADAVGCSRVTHINIGPRRDQLLELSDSPEVL